MSLNDELSTLFLNLSALMELRGDNVFKVIAFQKVGRILRDLNIDLKKCIEENKLCEVEGIGKGSQQIIEEFVNTGKSTVYEEVTASVPAGLVPRAPFAFTVCTRLSPMCRTRSDMPARRSLCLAVSK